jgi:hypothetical protein
LPHWPQFFSSSVVSTHAPSQEVSPVAHGVWQSPFLHARPASQACPHAPQWAASVDSSTHAPSHALCPSGHDVVGVGAFTQVPLAPHVEPLGQSLPLSHWMVTVLPQLAASTTPSEETATSAAM